MPHQVLDLTVEAMTGEERSGVTQRWRSVPRVRNRQKLPCDWRANFGIIPPERKQVLLAATVGNECPAGGKGELVND